jgi:hypothetical protein
MAVPLHIDTTRYPHLTLSRDPRSSCMQKHTEFPQEFRSAKNAAKALEVNLTFRYPVYTWYY